MISVALGQLVNYLDNLLLFNAMALVMVLAGVAAVLVGLIGTWRTRGRSALLWFADTIALLTVALYVFD